MTTARAEISMSALIGERIHQLMFRRRVTQIVMSKQLGLTQSALSKKLHGDRPWYPEELVHVARVLEVTVAGLFGETALDAPTPPAGPWAPRGSNPEPTDYKSLDSIAPINLAEHRRARRGQGSGQGTEQAGEPWRRTGI